MSPTQILLSCVGESASRLVSQHQATGSANNLNGVDCWLSLALEIGMQIGHLTNVPTN